MLVDFETCTDQATFEADVCIIGAGAAGITLSRDLIGAGFRVCLLESGGLDFESSTQDLAQGQSIGFPYYQPGDSRLRFFGGTTSIWGGRCAQLNECDFERRPWVPHSGWPYGKDTLAPYYRRAQHELELEEFEGGEETWDLHGLQAPPFDRDLLRTSFWQFDLVADRFAHRRCRDLMDSPNVTILLHANVIDIQANGDGTAIDKLHIANLRGGRGEARAKIYVLAAGGLENPRLLLASRSIQSTGLGNQNDLVGRFFMEHPHARGGHIVSEHFWQLLKMLPRSYQYEGRRYAALARASETLQQREGILNSSFTISVRQPPNEQMATLKNAYLTLKEELEPNRLGRALWHINRRFLLWAREGIGPALGWFRLKTSRDGLYTVVRGEQAPNPDSRVTLTSEKDALGVPRLALDWRFSDIDKHTVRVLMSALDKEIRRLGLGHVTPSPWLQEEDAPWQIDPLISNHPIGGFHHMGTTRMSASPSEGVVDADCRVHGLGNLFVAGSSVFPTSGWANPTLTLIALTLKLADHIKATHGPRGVR